MCLGVDSGLVGWHIDGRGGVLEGILMKVVVLDGILMEVVVSWRAY